jgi:hypothetical protein
MQKSIGQIRFGAPLFLAIVFKVLAVLSLFGGAVITVSGAIELSDTAREMGGDEELAAFVGAGLAGTIITSSFLAFFGYVLEILVEIYQQVWHGRFGETDAD